ncbi:MAG: hypothetical protein NT117_05210 [Gammaproteobacteria bacterium]|nr:hypothetical protein [Gammaproteobacteria bacterium]
MGKFVRATCWILAGWFLAYNLYVWGGLAVTPLAGKQLREQATLQSPIAASYLFLGRHAVSAAGLADRARDRAGKLFADEIADTDSLPQLILNRFLAAQSPSARLAYYGAPLFLVLSLVLHARRPKQIRSFGRRD